MGLHLNAVGEGNAVSEAAFKNIMPTVGGTGTEATEGKEVEPGIYKATVIVESSTGGSSEVIRFVDSPLYRVDRDGGVYVVTPWDMAPEDIPGETQNRKDRENAAGHEAEPEDFVQEPAKQAGCGHIVSYGIVREADAEQDAVLAGQCGICGEIVSYSYVANTAYGAFLKEAIEVISNAGEGEAVIETRRWVSFNQAVFDVISQHPETAVTVNYRYEGKEYTVTIPAGADVGGLCGESGFCGFRYLDQVFKGREITG